MLKLLYSFLKKSNSVLYVTLIKDSFPLSLAKEFLYQFVRLVTN